MKIHYIITKNGIKRLIPIRISCLGTFVLYKSRTISKRLPWNVLS